jgi:hypothetical protein
MGFSSAQATADRPSGDCEPNQNREGTTMRTGIPIMLLGAALLSSLLAGCKQAEGERCQIDDDCMSGLACVLSSTTREAGGYCKSTTAPAVLPDLATKPNPDLSMPPPPPDMTTTD